MKIKLKSYSDAIQDGEEFRQCAEFSIDLGEEDRYIWDIPLQRIFEAAFHIPPQEPEQPHPSGRQRGTAGALPHPLR